jgi:excisionase family DNA binding protein
MSGHDGERQLLTIEQTRHALGGVGRTKLYELFASGALRSVRIGRRRFVSPAAIDAYLQSLEDAVAPGAA